MTISDAKREYGPGHAWLAIQQEASPGLSVTVERESEKDRFLGPRGWQSTPEPIPIDTAAQNKLLLGPNIVDHLKEGMFVTIVVPELALEFQEIWPDVRVSGRKASGTGIVSNAKDPEKPKRPPTAAPSRPTAPPAPKEPVAPVTPEVPPVVTKNSGSAARIIGLVLATWFVIVAAVGFYYFDPLGWQGEVENTRIAAVPVPEPLGREHWLSVLADPSLTPDALYAAAQDTAGDPGISDISNEFLRLAAEKGHSVALREYARDLDPTNEQQMRTSIVKNAAMALDYYSRLKTQGDGEASGNIANLCASLKPDYYKTNDARTAFDDFCN